MQRKMALDDPADVTSTKWRRCATRAAAGSQESSTRPSVTWMPGRRASPCIRAPIAGTSRPRTSARSPARWHRGARRLNTTSRAIPGRSSRWCWRSGRINARSSRSRRGRSPARRAGAGPDAGTCRQRSSGFKRTACGSACSSTPARIRCDGRRRRRRSRGALHRAVRPRLRARRRSGPPFVRPERYTEAARLARSLGLGVNAGHDLDLDNLVVFRDLPFLDEVSIGHALISRRIREPREGRRRDTWTCWRPPPIARVMRIDRVITP